MMNKTQLAKIKSFVFEKLGLILFGIFVLDIMAAGFFFFFNGWAVVNSPSSVFQFQSPLNEALWRAISADVKKREAPRETPLEVRDVFRP